MCSFQKEHGNVEVHPTTGNFIARSEKASTQDGKMERGFTFPAGLWAVLWLPM